MTLLHLFQCLNDIFSGVEVDFKSVIMKTRILI